MRVLVCGGRDFGDSGFIYRALTAWHTAEPFSLVITGGARGADTIAHEWAITKTIPTSLFYANWPLYGKRAGPIRNQQMLDEGKPDLVLAFPGGKGTSHMVSIARHAHVRTIRLHPSGDIARACRNEAGGDLE